MMDPWAEARRREEAMRYAADLRLRERAMRVIKEILFWGVIWLVAVQMFSGDMSTTAAVVVASAVVIGANVIRVAFWAVISLYARKVYRPDFRIGSADDIGQCFGCGGYNGAHRAWCNRAPRMGDDSWVG